VFEGPTPFSMELSFLHGTSSKQFRSGLDHRGDFGKTSRLSFGPHGARLPKRLNYFVLKLIYVFPEEPLISIDFDESTIISTLGGDSGCLIHVHVR
jgi:hypothetical protein